MATKWLSNQAGSIYSMDMLDKGMIHILSGVEQDSMKFHHATHNCAQLFISEIVHWILLNHDWPQVTKTMESETLAG